MTNSQVELPYNPSTAQHTTAITSDQSHPYTRVRTPAHFRLQPRTPHPPTQRWPKPNTVPCTSPTSATPPLSPLPQFPYPEYGAGPSILLDNEQLSSPMTSSPHIPSTELPPQPTTSLESHSGKKRHKCNVCGSYWGRPSSLKIHMVSHTGVKGTTYPFSTRDRQTKISRPEFVCPICKQDFGVKSNYTRHVRVHHKDSSEGAQTRVAVRRRRGSRRSRDAGPVRFVDEGPRFQGQ